jgi:CDGSH-type Zn-finger protein
MPPTAEPPAMPREVTLDGRGPRYLDADDIDPDKGDVAVCQCGLSDEFPFCDGSHRATDDEDDDTRYKYVDGERRVIDRIEFADETVDGDAAADSGPADERDD